MVPIRYLSSYPSNYYCKDSRQRHSRKIGVFSVFVMIACLLVHADCVNRTHDHSEECLDVDDPEEVHLEFTSKIVKNGKFLCL